jgi:hypothetical protein
LAVRGEFAFWYLSNQRVHRAAEGGHI